MCPRDHRGTMENLEEIAADLEAYLDEKERVREDMLRRSREILKLSARTIAAMHRGAFVDGDVLRITDMTKDLREDLSDHKDIWHSGALENALQEAAEAAIVQAMLKGERLPHPDDLSVTVPAYLLGLCDSVGELRRFTLTSLKEGRFKDAEGHLASMDRVYDVISQYHYPKAIVPVKVKQDQIRGIIERTRGDVAMAIAGDRAAGRMETAGRD
ncbi:MAG: haloacid dehalogenase [Thermoplasmata archaeon]|nr:haloacid dehalogenase [Thermoplasmata archaeon]NIW82103.1 haloacid dehalogenase [Thermoplasmata archaeon]NIY03001.1 haloacid dehalogenase [Thermoplasmata archaeon]